MNQLAFNGNDDWTVLELQRFLHQLNIIYNRLYVLGEFKAHERGKLSSRLEGSLARVPEDKVLRIHSIEIHSPFKIGLTGSGEIFEQIREFIKDILYRNRLDRRRLEEDARHTREMNKMEETEKKLDVIAKYREQLIQMDLPPDEVEKCLSRLIEPVNQIVSLMDATGTVISRESGT